jgi:hypothetical protein
VHVGQDLLDLIGEEVREKEAERHADERGGGIDGQEFPEGHSGDSRQ